MFELKNSLVDFVSIYLYLWGIGRVEAESPLSPSSLVGTYI